MAKNSYKHIVEDEKKIINELQMNASKSVKDIAKSCNFSRQKVWRVIKNLEKNKTIWGYTAIINEENQGIKTFFILIKRTNKPVHKNVLEKTIIEGEITKFAKDVGLIIKSSHLVFGNYDWIMETTVKSIKEVKKFCEILNYNFEGYISDILILENLFTTSDCNIRNPDNSKLYDFLWSSKDMKTIKSKK